MSNSFLNIVTITTTQPDPARIDEQAGITAVDAIAAVDEFSNELLDLVQWEVDEDEHPDAYTGGGAPTLTGAQITARKLVKKLVETLRSDEVALLTVGPTALFAAGGISYGDLGSDAAEVIVDAYKLPIAVLHALGLARETSADPLFDKAVTTIDTNARDAGYEVMGSTGVLGILANRESIPLSELANIDPARINEYYDRFIGPAIDALEHEIHTEQENPSR